MKQEEKEKLIKEKMKLDLIANKRMSKVTLKGGLIDFDSIDFIEGQKAMSKSLVLAMRLANE